MRCQLSAESRFCSARASAESASEHSKRGAGGPRRCAAAPSLRASVPRPPESQSSKSALQERREKREREIYIYYIYIRMYTYRNIQLISTYTHNTNTYTQLQNYAYPLRRTLTYIVHLFIYTGVYVYGEIDVCVICKAVYSACPSVCMHVYMYICMYVCM